MLNLIPGGCEREGIFKSDRWEDRKRALLSRLLVRRACAQALGLDGFDGICIGRTFGGKPFLKSPLPDSMPNFNFNVSHDGLWVVLASDPLCLVGADVSAPQRVRGDAEDDSWIEELSNLLYENELATIREQTSVRERYAVFQQLWSAKEAVAKAVGQGLEFGLERIEVDLHRDSSSFDPRSISEWFRTWLPASGRAAPGDSDGEGHQADSTAYGRGDAPSPTSSPDPPSIFIDTWSRPDWHLSQHQLGEDHWVSVVLGPVEEVIDRDGEFAKTLRLRDLPLCELRLPPAPDFEVLTTESLVPPSLRGQFLVTRSS